jgi:DNA-binding NarL/FixJ family response regulator
MTIRVVIADDQQLMRSALRMCLESEPDIEVLAEAGDGLTAIELVRRLTPDVVLLDIRMPQLDGVETTRRLTNPADGAGPPAKILMITSFDLDDYIVEALRAGASGFLLKDASADEVIRAVRVIAAGEALLAPAVTRRLLDRYARLLPPPGESRDTVDGLTNRELTVLRLVARGHTNAEIADALNLAHSSVKTHVGHLLSKLRMTDRVQLVIFAYETGLIQPSGRLAEG